MSASPRRGDQHPRLAIDDGVVFVSRGRDRVKILTWDNGGFVLFYKRLEAGRFRVPKFEDDALAVKNDATSLAMLLDGIDLKDQEE